MKITYISHGTHWEASIEPVLETLKERGHEIIRCEPKIRNIEVIPNDIDIVLLTSNEDTPVIWKQTKQFFIPHGIGDERWNPIMDNYDKILLAGKKPWYSDSKNSKIVGWAKSDVLFNPKKDKEDYVKNLMSNLPYDQSVLCIPYPDDIGPKLHFLVDYFNSRKINVIASYPDYYLEAKQYFKNYNHVIISKISNLYYFVPYIKILVCSGFTSVGREFYITQIPTMHIGKGFEESINLSSPEKQFDSIFSKIWEDPKLYLQPESITKQFIEINDGKTVERIIREIEP
jgi:hypothetical protein